MASPVNTLFFDMNSFFASVWQAEEPSLRGRPVGVVTVDAPGAMLIAASREAKAAGAGGLIRVRDARRMCPDIEMREAKHDLFVDYHHRIRAAVETVLPIHMAHSVDECSCLLTGSQRNLETALALGAAVQRAILERVSPALTCSVGVAPNKLLAKIAAELQKPAGLNWLTPEVLPGKIAHLRLKDLPGVSTGTLRRLEGAGVANIASLYAMTPKAARHLWGSVEGERFLRQLQGEVISAPDTKRSHIGHGQLLTPQNRSPEGARLVARRLLVKAASRLRREALFARALSVSVTCEVSGKTTSDGNILPTQDSFALLDTFERYWDRLAFTTPVSVSVMLGVQDETAHASDLFEDRGAGEATTREDLCRSIDNLNAKFGQDTIRFGELPPHKVAYTGAKIAFGRIPDREEFSE